MPENVLYKLTNMSRDPEFEGFGFVRGDSIRGKGRLTWDFGPDDVQTKGRAWTVTRMASFWTPQLVAGRVDPREDYPCVNLTIPAFSRRAVDALRDFLELNGELLPLVSSVGEYYAYNITTVADILDHEKSDIEWFREDQGVPKKQVIALHIRRYECIPERLAGLSIFRLVEEPHLTLVHQVFVDRVRQHRLNGFDFIRLYPLPDGTSVGD
jgi:hypothetical protein